MAANVGSLPSEQLMCLPKATWTASGGLIFRSKGARMLLPGKRSYLCAGSGQVKGKVVDERAVRARGP